MGSPKEDDEREAEQTIGPRMAGEAAGLECEKGLIGEGVPFLVLPGHHRFREPYR